MSEIDSTIINSWRSKNRGTSPTSATNESAHETTVGRWSAMSKKILNQAKEESKESSVSPESKGFRLITYKLYSLSWKFMYSLYLLPIIYLWIHFLVKYLGFFKGFSNFVNPFAPAGLKDELTKDEGGNTDLGWMIVFICLSVVVLAIITLLIIIIYIIIQYQQMSLSDKAILMPGVAVELITGGPDEAIMYALESILGK